MKKILLGLVSVAFLASCGSSDHGELVGVQNRPTWYPSEPYGMVYIPQGSFTMGNHDEDVPYAYTAPAKVVSVPAFYMDQTEVTNNEYRQFVNWVRDSITRTRLAEGLVEDFEYIDLAEMEDPTFFQEYVALNYPDSMMRRLDWDPYLEWDKNRYPSAETVHFQAGLEVSLLHHGMSLMAKIVQMKLVRNWSPLTKWIVKGSELLLPFGTNDGGMQVTLQGVGKNGKKLKIDWTLFAEGGVGPYIPIISTVILAKKLVSQSINETGAKACLGMYSLKEFDEYANTWGIYHIEQTNQPHAIIN